MKLYSIALIVVATFTIVTVTTICNVVMIAVIDDDKNALFLNFRQRAYVSSISYLSENFNFATTQDIFVQKMCRFTKEKMFQILQHVDLQNIRFRNRFATNSEIALTMFCARLFYSNRLKSLMHSFDYNKT